MRVWIVLGLVLSIVYQSLAQKKPTDVDAIYLHFSWSYQLPQGDMADRFGDSQNVGVQAEWIFEKSNIIVGVSSDFFYGNAVKEDIGALFRNEQGVIFGIDQTATNLTLKERGFYYGLHFGKLFAINKKKNPRSGIRLVLGVGQMQHYIRISDEFDSAGQFKGDYKKGYDRLTGGLTVVPFLGYQHTSTSRRMNLFAGIDYHAGFTQSQRSWDFDRLGPDTKSRKDGLLGFRAGISLPIFVGDSKGDVVY